MPAVIVATCPVLAWFVLTRLGTGTPTYAFIGVLGLIVAVYVGLYHPLWLYWAFAVILAGLPFGTFPGIHVPLYLAFGPAIVLAAIIYPRTETPFHPLEKAILVLVFAGGVSVIATSFSLGGFYQYGKWSIMTLVAVALTRLSREDLERFGRIFVVVSTANALWGILLATVDKTQKSFFILRPFGYDVARVEEGVRNGEQHLVNWAYGADGSKAIRLGGTWIAGNGASIAFLVTIVICMVLFHGWRRMVMLVILSVALLLTLSRQSIFTLMVGLALVAIFHSVRARYRWYAAGTFATLIVLAFSVPYIRDRLLSSFSKHDPGGEARRASLSDFPNVVGGHWLFGLGWSRPEFKSGAASYALNLISNAPLLHVYRAGIFTGLAFLAILIIGCVISFRALRSDSLPFAVYGGVFIADCFVGLQLDHGVTDVPQTILCFSVLLAFLVYVDRLLREQVRPPIGEQVIAGGLPPASSDLHTKPHSEGESRLDRPTVAR